MPTKRRVWTASYAAGAAMCLGHGFASLDPAKTAGTNADWILVTLCLVPGLVLPVATVRQAEKRGG